MPDALSPTRMRLVVVLVTMLVSVLLYLDRFCLSFAESFIREDLALTSSQSGWLMSAFFWSYGLAQVPSGWLTDRWGGRLMLTIYVLAWSAFTGLTGAAIGFASLFIMRLGVGMGQAGAYPTAASLVSRWVPVSQRGTASSVVAMGGRIGGALAPVLTAYLIVLCVPASVPSTVGVADLIDAPGLALQLHRAASPAKESADLPPAAQRKEAAVRQVSELVTARLSPAGTEVVSRFGRKYEQVLADGAKLSADEKKQLGDRLLPTHDRELLAEDLNRVVQCDDIYQPDTFQEFDLPREAKRYRAKIEAGGQLAPQQRERFHRLLLEAVYPTQLKKVYGAGWRWVMLIFGALGLFVAALYWTCLRDRPQDHTRCNEAERRLILEGRPAEAAGAERGKTPPAPLRALVRNGNLWLANISMFFTNIGWVFIVTWMMRYFENVYQTPVEVRGWIGFIPIAVGAVGMVFGGRLTDRLVRRIGLRWGRALPMGLSRFAAMAAYGVCLCHPQSPWVAVAAFAAVAMFTDLGIGAIWAYCQDVGGRNVATVLGWTNMWGNFGAAVGPVVIGTLLGDSPGASPERWDWAIILCAASFGISGATALMVDATRPALPLNPEP